MNRDGFLIIIVAPSGTGKSTLIKRLMKDLPELKWSTSYTTRPPRTGEVHGENYFFVSLEEFQSMLNSQDFLEYAVVHSNYYGTSKTFINDRLSAGDVILLDLDVQGADRVKAHFKNRAKAIFIEPPSIEELERRLRDRGTESDQVISERIQNAKNELLKKNSYDFLILNDDIEKAYQRLKSLVSDLCRK